MGLCSCFAAFSISNRVTLVVSLAVLAGCQTAQTGLGDRIAIYAANVDLSGLTADFTIPELNVRAAIPYGWKAMATDISPFYVHQQWRSPGRNIGVGVALIHMPFPMSAKTLCWLARTQYSKQTVSEHQPDAQVLGEWTDGLGREWFEGGNARYHVKGYVVTNGSDAWAVYSGYRLRSPPTKREMNLAFRSMDSIVPIPMSLTVAVDKWPARNNE